MPQRPPLKLVTVSAQSEKPPLKLTTAGSPASQLPQSAAPEPPPLTVTVPTTLGKIPIPIPKQAEDFSKWALSKMPSAQTALRTGGAAIGGAIGLAGGTIAGTPIAGAPGALLGGAAGSSIGESVYQLGKKMFSPEAPPSTPEEVVQGQTSALASGALQEGIPAWVLAKFPARLVKGATANIEQAVRPSGKAAEERARAVAPEVVGRLPIARNINRLAADVESISDAANRTVNHAYSSTMQQYPNTAFSPQRIVQRLLRERAKWVVRGRPIEGQETRVAQIDELVNNLSIDKRLSLTELRSKKQGWDDLVNFNKYSNAPTKDPIKAQIHELAANEARDMIHSAFPTLGKADAESHVWSTLRSLTKDADMAGSNREWIDALTKRYGLASTIGAGIGAGSSWLGGRDPWKGAVAGGLLAIIPKTTLWDTLNASSKVALADFLKSTGGQAAAKGLGMAGSVIGQEAIPDLSKVKIQLAPEDIPK